MADFGLSNAWGISSPIISLWKETFGECHDFPSFFEKVRELASDRSSESKLLIQKLKGYRKISSVAGIVYEISDLAAHVDALFPDWCKSEKAALVDTYGYRFTILDRIHDQYGFAYLSDFVRAVDWMNEGGSL